MGLPALAADWELRRWRLFRARARLALPGRLLLAVGLACLTGVLAQLRIPLPNTPVPITGQVFAVLLAGVAGGGATGALSQAIYLGAGAAGIPWFAGGSCGLPLGPSGGYLIGFVPAAALVGYLTDRHVWVRKPWGQAAALASGIAVIWLFGAVQFAMVMGTGLWGTLAGAVLPFVTVDLAKALWVAALTSTILPRKAYRGRAADDGPQQG